MLVGGMATACGSPPEDASKDDFCKQFEKFGEVNDEDSFNDFKDELKDLGTPEEIDGDAREGFEIMVDLDWNDTQDEDSVDKDDQEKVTTFFTKAAELCAGGEAPTGDGESTDVPTDIPSDLESSLDDLESQLDELPTEVPSE
ncbi:hypothetical protein GCM10009668_22320 [Nocardioides dubius]|uniref:Uncharacterized protein n=1 Tax=Nocardioides dubius TaxID=317019 RepID=A0ABN1TV00_9ACTN